jgi:hypothetical protein
MTAWVECNDHWGKSKSQASMEEEDFLVGKRKKNYNYQEVRKK